MGDLVLRRGLRPPCWGFDRFIYDRLWEDSFVWNVMSKVFLERFSLTIPGLDSGLFSSSSAGG